MTKGGIIYPLAITALAQLFFSKEAGRSLLYDSGGKIMGSAIVGQPFSDPKYFWSRPSATSDYP